jgi:hypothetical protein
MIAFGVELLEINSRNKASRRLEMINDGKRNQHRAAPIAHLVEVHVKPFPDQNDFAGNRRNIIPREHSQQRQIEFGKCVHPRNPTEAERDLTGSEHSRIRDRNSGQLQRQICFDGGVHFGGPPVINVPAAVQ